MTTGGDESRLIQYLNARDDVDFEHVVLVGMDQDGASVRLNGPLFERFRATGVEVLPMGVPSDHEERRQGGSPGLKLRQGRAFGQIVHRLATTMRQRGIDVVDGRVNMGTAVATLAARRAGVRAVVSTNYELSTFSSKAMWPLGQAVYAMTDALVSDSQAAIDMMRAWMLSPPPGFNIPNGVVPPAPTRAAEALRAELGLPAGARVVGQVARLQHIKGQDLLLQAAPRLLAVHPDVHLLLVGYRQLAVEYQAGLDRLVEQHGLRDRVHFVSYPGPIGDVWQLIDVHAHPTRRDSSPMALMEGMSLGKPVVTTKIGGIEEIVTNEETGLVIAPNDVDALGTALIRLLSDEALARRLGQAAFARYQARHRPETMARAIERLYREVHADPKGFRARAA